MDTLETFVNLVSNGGPVAIATIFAILWWMERKQLIECHARQQVLEDKLLTLSTTSMETSTKLEAAISSLREMLVQLLARR